MIANILTQLGIDNTLWIQFGIFTALFFLLKFIYFKPFLAVFEQRENATKGVEGTASGMQEDASKKEAEYNEKLKAAKARALDEKLKLINDAKKEASEQTNKARVHSKTKIETERSKTEKESEQLLQDLKGNVDKITNLFVEKLLKSKVKM